MHRFGSFRARLTRSLALFLIPFWAACGPLAWGVGAAQAQAQARPPESLVPKASESAESSASAQWVRRKWVTVPPAWGRITAEQLGVVINLDDPYSVEVGEHYVRARKIPAKQVLRLRLPPKATLDREAFFALRRQIDGHFGPRTQALALAWRQPQAVECHSITGALAMGFDPALCADTCAPSKLSRYAGSGSTQPLRDFGMRLSMLLAAPDVAQAKAMIDRGVASDGTLSAPGGQPAHAHFVSTSDTLRSVRRALFPPSGPMAQAGVEVHVHQTEALRDADRVLIYLTGRTHVDGLETIGFLPGALADHFTSFGGVIDKPHGQMSALAWIQAGATATHGTVSEPCAHLQKFPHPQLLLLFYTQGATALEAYWKSVAWPRQSLFIGEPLAAPFAR